jgi:hypothetical protein
MNLNDKYEARLLIRELVQEGETFEAAKARRLIEIVPPRTVFNMRAPRGPTTFGFTPEMGNTGYDDPRGRHENPYYPERISEFGVHHEPGLIVIANKAGMEKTDVRGGTVCSIDYDFSTKEPSGMRLAQMKLVRIWGIIPLRVMALEPWKTPRGGRTPAPGTQP